MRSAPTILSVIGALSLLGCQAGVISGEQGLPGDQQENPQLIKELKGLELFTFETFGGNDRTCETCHNFFTGALSPAEAQARFEWDPTDPLFRSIDSDDGVGESYTKLLADATIRVEIPLNPNVRLGDDPAATSMVVRRGVPSVINSSLEPVLMHDGRFSTLEDQAMGAVLSHYEPAELPTNEELGQIAAFERTLFSSFQLVLFAKWGIAPTLPAGKTAAEKRGREWFIEKEGVGNCATCHAGPMLNTTSQFAPTIPVPPQFQIPPGLRFFTAFVSEINKAGNPRRPFVFTLPNGATLTVNSPDIGLAARTGDPRHQNFFRIPTVWNVKNTAPYFHDNSARTLEELMQHYDQYFQIVGLGGISPQDQADIIAYMKLL